MEINFYKGLKFKMTLVFSVVFMLISIGFGRYVYQYFQKSYVDTYNKYLFSRAKILLDRTEINPDIIALPDTGESVRYFYTDYNEQPHLLFQSPGPISRVAVPYKTSVTDTLNMHGVYLHKENDYGQQIEILLTVPNFSLQKKLHYLAVLMIVSTLISVIISALAVYLVSGWLLKPVRQIIHSATQINTDKLNTRLVVSHTHDELQELTETINAMLGRIEHEQMIQNNFFAAASHELRTPLAVLRAETELHLQQEVTNNNNADLLNSQLVEIDRLQHVVQQFLLTSELKHNGLSLMQAEVDLSDQLLKVFARNQYVIKQQSLQTAIIFDEQASSYSILGDYDKLEIVWQNLLLNAVKYAVPGTKIECGVNQTIDYTTVFIGNKIAKQSVETKNLGTAFFQTGATNAGSGLGLWLSRQIIELHQAKIIFSSQNYNFFVEVRFKNPTDFTVIKEAL